MKTNSKVKSIRTAKHKQVYLVSESLLTQGKKKSEGLVDSGANGGLMGWEMRVMDDTDKITPDTCYVKVTGINDHQLPNKPIVKCCSVSVDTNEEAVLCIYNEYAKCDEMVGSIHSKVLILL